MSSGFSRNIYHFLYSAKFHVLFWWFVGAVQLKKHFYYELKLNNGKVQQKYVGKNI